MESKLLGRGQTYWWRTERYVESKHILEDKQLSGKQKSLIRETKHLSTDADSSTDTIVWWTKNTPKPNFFEKRKKSPITQKLKNV